MLSVKAEQIASFLGHKITPQLAQELGTQFSTRIEGTCIKHRFASSSIKMYDQFGCILRIETTTNDVSFFKHHRKVEHRERPATRALAPVKKTIYSLIDLREILLGCNRRYLAHLSALDDFSAGVRALERLTKPRSIDGRSGWGSMRAPKERFDFVHEFLNRIFIDDLHAKRVLSLANGTLGVMSGACLAVSLIGQALAKARGLFAKSAIKQVDRLLSNAGVVPWELFGLWVREVVGERREIVVAMDWTDFDADNQSTLALHLITRHGRATPLIWLTVDKDELKNQRNDF